MDIYEIICLIKPTKSEKLENADCQHYFLALQHYHRSSGRAYFIT
jgi:hypothetical protein